MNRDLIGHSYFVQLDIGVNAIANRMTIRNSSFELQLYIIFVNKK